MSAEPLDRARVEDLAARLLAELRVEMTKFPVSRDNVFVVLNALAVAAASVLAATDRDGRRFFEAALADNLALLLRSMPSRGPGDG